jgi:hypothetical protein
LQPFPEGFVRRFRQFFVAGGLIACSGCINPEVEARQWDEIQNAVQTATDARTYVGDLEATVDSLRGVVAKQDSAIRILADFTGAIVPGYRQ